MDTTRGAGHAGFVAGESLRWSRPRWLAPRWELGDDHGRVAVFERIGMLGRHWSLAAGERRWRIVAGWFGGAELRAADGALLVTYRPGWLGRGRLVLADGGTLRWRHRWLSIWQPGLEVATEDGATLIRYEWRPTQGRFKGAVTLESAALRRDDLETLVLLGWALALLSLGQSHAGHGGH